MAKKSRWVYGQSPNPKTWHAAADVLKSMTKRPTAKKESPNGTK